MAAKPKPAAKPKLASAAKKENALHAVLPTMYKGKWGALNIALTYFVLLKAYQYNILLRPFEALELSPNQSNCRLLGENIATGSEDLTILGDGKVLVSSGDLGPLLINPSDLRPDGMLTDDKKTFTPGSMVILDVNTEHIKTLPTRGIPDGVPFQPHGIYFSNSTQRVYTITHGFASGGSRIMIFDLVKTGGSVTHLQYQRSVTSPLFLNAGINDVVEGSEEGKELYVTQWLQFAYPMNGKHYPSGAREIMNSVAQEIANLFLAMFSPCRVFRCSWKVDVDIQDKDEAHCTVAEGPLSKFFNGITISPDRSTLYVNDLLHAQLLVFSRSDDGSLLPLPNETIHMPWAVDNIEWDSGTGQIFMGSMPNILNSFMNSLFGLDLVVAGGLQVAHKMKGGWEVDGNAFMHSGHKLSQISAAVAYGKKVVLGSPFNNGVLVCDQK